MRFIGEGLFNSDDSTLPKILLTVQVTSEALFVAQGTTQVVCSSSNQSNTIKDRPNLVNKQTGHKSTCRHYSHKSTKCPDNSGHDSTKVPSSYIQVTSEVLTSAKCN